MQRVGHVALRDAEREALDDRGLADAGLADQHGVVLAPAGEDLDGLLDLVRAPDHGIDPAGRRLGGQVAAELVERWGLGLRLLRSAPAAPRPAGTPPCAAIRRVAQGSQTMAARRCTPSEATTRIVPGRSPQTAHVPPATAPGESV